MRKVIDTMAVLSFAVSAAVVGGAGYLYVQKDALIDSVKEQATEQITGIVTDAIGGALGGGLTESLPGGGGESTPSLPGLPF